MNKWYLTFCSLDKGLLKGGLREGHHTEVAGESGSGKTQLCMQVWIGSPAYDLHGRMTADGSRTPYSKMIPGRPEGT